VTSGERLPSRRFVSNVRRIFSQTRSNFPRRLYTCYVSLLAPSRETIISLKPLVTRRRIRSSLSCRLRLVLMALRTFLEFARLIKSSRCVFSSGSPQLKNWSDAHNSKRCAAVDVGAGL
jgi:hypothetical protein